MINVNIGQMPRKDNLGQIHFDKFPDQKLIMFTQFILRIY